MQTVLEQYSSAVRAGIVGLLIAFIFFTLRELVAYPHLFFGAILAGVVALLLARKAAHHFHIHHTHTGDSAFDAIALTVLFLANILHPAVDGFSLYETFVSRGIFAGGLFVFGLILHEFVRQSALITAFKTMGVRWWWVVLTAAVGICIGFGTGILGSEILHKHEGLIDIATIFAYVFIMGEFSFDDYHKETKGTLWFVVLGLVVGTLLSLFLKAY